MVTLKSSSPYIRYCLLKERPLTQKTNSAKCSGYTISLNYQPHVFEHKDGFLIHVAIVPNLFKTDRELGVSFKTFTFDRIIPPGKLSNFVILHRHH